MLLTLTDSELITYRMLMAGMEPTDLNFTIERTDGIDVDAIVANRLRRWYVELLRTAPVELLPVENVAARAVLNHCVVQLPEGSLRPQSVRLANWTMPVVIEPQERCEEIVKMQSNSFLKATPAYPVAVHYPGKPNCLLVYPPSGAVAELFAVKDPGDSVYILDESLLNQLPIDSIFNNV